MIWAAGLGVIVAYLAIGPLGHLSQIYYGIPDIISLGLWLACWLSGNKIALTYAIVLGLILDLTLFAYPGIFTGLFCIIYFLTQYFKKRNLDESNIIHSIVSLFAITAFIWLFFSAYAHYFDLKSFIYTAISNLVLGIIIYYLVVKRFNLLSHWRGQKI